MDLPGKIALITGGAQGIGSATARLFARERASVAVADINSVRLAALEAQINESGGDMLAITADCGSAAGLDEAIARVSSRYGDSISWSAAPSSGPPSHSWM